MTDREVVREQFGAHAGAYVDSESHARGRSLQRLVEVVDPRPGWEVLDVATGAGHTALAFAPRVAWVWATDITGPMLEAARQLVAARAVGNVTVEHADAEDLPYPDGRFDLVMCRLAAHHFGDVGAFLGQAARVVRSGGVVAVVDNVVPDGPAGEYVNAFERLRDPGHGRCLAVAEWRAALAAAGLDVVHEETLDKTLVFESWAERHDAITRRFLAAMLTEVAGEAAEFLAPRISPDAGATFRLREALWVTVRRG